MTPEQQIAAVAPLLNELQAILSQGTHPDASPRFKTSPGAIVEQGGALAQLEPVETKAKEPLEALAQCAEWLELKAQEDTRDANEINLKKNPHLADARYAKLAFAKKMRLWATAAREASES